MTQKICFIGAGNMASSIIGGLIGQGMARSDITVADTVPAQLSKVAQKFQVAASTSNTEAAAGAAAVLLAVKPDVMQRVCVELAGALADDCLLVSVAAGVRAVDIQRWLAQDIAIVRCMPNTPALLNLGANALCANAHCSSSQRAQAEHLLQATGITIWVDSEEQIDTVTALSGSGPAYFFHLIECMTDAAVAMGLDQEVAETLAIETAYGAAAMARQRTSPAAQLRENVTSRGGTTAAALGVFSAANFKGTVADAMAAAKNRAHTLGDEFGQESAH